MPLYTYTCRTHGEFKAWGKMSESDAPMPCPTCSTVSPRALARPMVAKGAGEGGGADDLGCGMDGCGMGACGMETAGGDGAHVCGADCMH